MWEFHQSTHKRKSNWEVISYFCISGTTSKVFWVLTWGPFERHLQKNKQTNEQKSSVINKKVHRVILVFYQSILGLDKRYVKFRTGKIWLGIAFTVCTYRWNHLLKLPGTGINDGKWNTKFRLEWSDFRMPLKNGFGKYLLFVLSANGWKDQNMDSSFSCQRKP